MRICGIFLPLLKSPYHNRHPPLWRLQPFSYARRKILKDAVINGQELQKPLLKHRITNPFWPNILHVQFYSQHSNNIILQTPVQVLQEDCQKEEEEKKFVLPVGVFAPKDDSNDAKFIMVPLDVASLDGAGLKKMMTSINKIQLQGQQVEEFASNEIKNIDKPTDQNIFLKFKITNDQANKKEESQEVLPLEQSNDIIEIDDKFKPQVQQLIVDIPKAMEDRLNDLAIASMQLTFNVDMANISETIASRASDGKCIDESRVLYQTKVDLNVGDAAEDIIPLNFSAEMRGKVEIDAKKLVGNQVRLPDFNENLTSIATYICSTAMNKTCSASARDSSSDICVLSLDEFSSKLKKVRILDSSSQTVADDPKPGIALKRVQAVKDVVCDKNNKRDPCAKKYCTYIGRSHWTPSCRSMSTAALVTNFNENTDTNGKLISKFSFSFRPHLLVHNYSNRAKFLSSFFRHYSKKKKDKYCKDVKPKFSTKKCIRIGEKSGRRKKKKEKAIPGLKSDCYGGECIKKHCKDGDQVLKEVQKLYKCKKRYKKGDECKKKKKPKKKKKQKEEKKLTPCQLKAKLRKR